LEIEKLNNCLKEMDALWRVKPNYEDVSLTLLFHCQNGGQYENVSLSIRLEDPYSFHLPFAQNGDFYAEVLDIEEARSFIPDEYHESNLKVLLVHIDEFEKPFYCAFSELTWSAQGPQTLNEHELCAPL
jgi:hypothetical protein